MSDQVTEVRAAQARWRELCLERPRSLLIEWGNSSRSQQLTLTSDDALTVREYGGPIYQMGQVFNTQAATVEQWRGQATEGLHRQLLEGLIAAGFPCSLENHMPYSGEGGSFALLRGSSEEDTAGMLLYSRLVDAHPELKSATRTLEGDAYQLTQSVDSEAIPNPDAQDWRREPGPRWPVIAEYDMSMRGFTRGGAPPMAATAAPVEGGARRLVLIVAIALVVAAVAWFLLG